MRTGPPVPQCRWGLEDIAFMRRYPRFCGGDGFYSACDDGYGEAIQSTAPFTMLHISRQRALHNKSTADT